MADCIKDYLDPLACVDRYLKQFRRDGLYKTISTGTSDHEGRWQAFVDYSSTYNRCFSNPKRLLEYGIDEDEIGVIEEAAFDIVRLRIVPNMDKLHVIMRNLPKYCRTKEGKNAIKKIAEEVEPVLAKDECYGPKGQDLTLSELDAKWAAKHQQLITWQLKKASQSHEILKEKETPVDLLEAALKKLNHNNMDVSSM